MLSGHAMVMGSAVLPQQVVSKVQYKDEKQQQKLERGVFGTGAIIKTRMLVIVGKSRLLLLPQRRRRGQGLARAMNPALRQQRDLDQQHRFNMLLAVRYDIGLDTVDLFPPHVPAMELSVGSGGKLLTPDAYGQQCVDDVSDVWEYTMGHVFGGLRSAQTFGAGVEASWGWQ